MIQQDNVKDFILNDLAEIRKICNEEETIKNSLRLKECVKEILEWID